MWCIPYMGAIFQQLQFVFSLGVAKDTGIKLQLLS
jgi:hypothetical protein